MAKTRLSKHTAINPLHVPITPSSSLQNSRRSVRLKLNNLVTARKQITSPHKVLSLSSSRNHSIIPHVQTPRDVTRRSMIMVMGGYVRNVIEHGQLLFTGTSPYRVMGRADGQIHSPNQPYGPRWSDVDNGFQRGSRANDGYFGKRPARIER